MYVHLNLEGDVVGEYNSPQPQLAEYPHYAVLDDKDPRVQKYLQAQVRVAVSEDQKHNDAIYGQLEDIDQKKVRAITDFLLGYSTVKLEALERHAQILRNQIRRTS